MINPALPYQVNTERDKSYLSSTGTMELVVPTSAGGATWAAPRRGDIALGFQFIFAFFPWFFTDLGFCGF
jgi:hypothetical protein